MNQQKRDFLREAVGFAEHEQGKPFELGFAGGRSGISYGRMQNDVAANDEAKRTLYRELTRTQGETGLDQSEIIKAMIIGSRPGIDMKTFDKQLPHAREKIDTALELSRDAVAAQDDMAASNMFNQVENALTAARQNEHGPGELGTSPNMRLLAKMGAWSNQSGGLKETADFFRNAPEITEAAYDGYLRGRRQFNKDVNPQAKSYDTWSGRIARATEVGRNAAGVPVNGFNSESFDVTAPEWSKGGNMFNSDGYRANMLNAVEEDFRKSGRHG